MRLAVLSVAVATFCIQAIFIPAGAQAPFPARHMTLVVPFAAGGPNDVMSRIVAEHMSRTLGQTIVVENVSGAGGTIGSTRVATAVPDGYTFVSGHVGTHAAAPALYPNLRYDPVADFVPIGLVAETPILVATKRDLPATTFAAFTSYARERGAQMTLGHAGIGSISHISCLMLTAALGVKPTELAYRGSAPAMTDLLAGHYDVTCALLVDALPYVASDRMRFLAVSAPSRVPQAPAVPTASEVGLPQFAASSWFAFFLPRATPDAIRDRLTTALKSALDDAGVRGRLEAAGLIVPPADQRGPDPLKRRMTDEIARWSAIVKAAQIQLPQ
jgi:tripartite-type tricarboxylate transporter receptor subunit TctC